MRYITLTEELKAQALQDLQNKLNEGRFADNKINFTFDLNKMQTVTDKIILNIKSDAWLKMWSLVHTESGEIGWHGTVERKAENIFEITDILVYPQFVTGATVETDDVGYGNWLHKEISDEQINNLRFHGHSHVNMGIHPSGVDTTWYNEILQGLCKNDFYIFMILNKKEDKFIEIYDLKTNTIYEKDDIVINVIMTDNNYLTNWVTNTKAKALQTRAVQRITTTKADPEQTEVEEYLLDICDSDLKDIALFKAILADLAKNLYKTGYYGVGYIRWSNASDIDKIHLAQTYFKAESLKYTKFKKSKKRGFSWEDEYGYGKYY